MEWKRAGRIKLVILFVMFFIGLVVYLIGYVRYCTQKGVIEQAVELIEKALKEEDKVSELIKIDVTKLGNMSEESSEPNNILNINRYVCEFNEIVDACENVTAKDKIIEIPKGATRVCSLQKYTDLLKSTPLVNDLLSLKDYDTSNLPNMDMYIWTEASEITIFEILDNTYILVNIQANILSMGASIESGKIR